MTNKTTNKIVIAVIALLAGATAYFHIETIKFEKMYQKSLFEVSERQRELDSLNIRYTDLEKSYHKLDSLDAINIERIKQLKRENSDLQSQLANLDNDMETIPYDSSYTYMMHRYLPTQDSLPYGFAPNQVRSIHRDILAFDITKKLNLNYESLLNVSDSLYYNMSIRFNTCDQQKSILLQENNILTDQVNQYATINNKNQRKLRTVKTVGGTVIILETAYIIIKAFL